MSSFHFKSFLRLFHLTGTLKANAIFTIEVFKLNGRDDVQRNQMLLKANLHNDISPNEAFFLAANE